MPWRRNEFLYLQDVGKARSVHHASQNQELSRKIGNRVENLSRLCWTARWGRYEIHTVAEASECPDHLGGTHLRLPLVDRWPKFLILDALVQDLPNQTT